MSIVPDSTSSAYAILLISAITFLAPSRFASIAERMFASSAFVTATNTSALSTFSSSSSSSSAESPCNTTALVSCSRNLPGALIVALDDLYLVIRLFERAREIEPDVAAARDHDLAHRIVELAHLAQHGADVLARRNEEHLVIFLDHGVAVRDDPFAAAVHRDDARLDVRDVLRQLAQRVADQRTAARARASRRAARDRPRNRAPGARRGNGSAARCNPLRATRADRYVHRDAAGARTAARGSSSRARGCARSASACGTV